MRHPPMRAPLALVLLATWVTTVAGCSEATDEATPQPFPWDGLGEAKTDPFARALVGVASPYEPAPGLREREEALRSDMRARREAAWRTVHEVLEPAPLLGLAGDQAEHPEIELPEELPEVPRFATWYGVDDFKRMFQHLYEGLGPAGRRVRAPFAAADIEAAFEWNAAALERSSSWPLERYIDHVNRLGECPSGLDPDQCDALLGRKVSGAAGGIARISYSPGTLSHVLGNYDVVLECLEQLDTLEIDEAPPSDERFTRCFRDEFPLDAVLIKAQWERADFGRTIPVWDTDAEALASRLAGDADWGEEGDRQSDPSPDRIHTIELRNGATYRLVGLHIMSKELRHWQWITLWWSDRPDVDFGADRPEMIRDELPEVWSHYKMCTVTFFEEEDTQIAQRFAELPSLADALEVGSNGPTWCSNPYIEHGTGNAGTNCIGCHQHGGATVAYDLDDDGVLDPLVQETIIDDAELFPERGRTQLRELFPADYLYSFNHVDDLSQVIESEVDYFDFQDGQALESRIEDILSRRSDPQAGRERFVERCTGCHGWDGTGATGPSLFERVPLRDDRSLLTTLVRGRGAMPSWGEVLSDAALADLGAYLRSNFDPPEPG